MNCPGNPTRAWAPSPGSGNAGSWQPGYADVALSYPFADGITEILFNTQTHLFAGYVPNGVGPNFRYCSREYFDCADHTVILTHVSMAEHLHAAGFAVELAVLPRFLPSPSAACCPRRPRLTRAYLRTPPLWRLLGKQFFLVARK